MINLQPVLQVTWTVCNLMSVYEQFEDDLETGRGGVSLLSVVHGQYVSSLRTIHGLAWAICILSADSRVHLVIYHAPMADLTLNNMETKTFLSAPVNHWTTSRLSPNYPRINTEILSQNSEILSQNSEIVPSEKKIFVLFF